MYQYIETMIGTLVEKQWKIGVWVYLWTLNSMLLFYMSILLPMPYWLDYRSFIETSFFTHHWVAGRGPLPVQWHWTCSLSSRLSLSLPALPNGTHNALLCVPWGGLHTQGPCPKMPAQMCLHKKMRVNWKRGWDPFGQSPSDLSPRLWVILAVIR